MTKRIVNPNNPLRKVASAPAQTRNVDQDGQFNPKRFAGYRDENLASKRPVDAKSERVYNDAGEINAWDRRDALTQAAHAVRASGDMKRSAAAEAQQNLRAIRAAFQSDNEGFALVGQEMTGPIKLQLDREGVARKILKVRTIPAGEQWHVARDIRVQANTTGQNGQGIVSEVFGNYVIPTTDIISSYSMIGMNEISQINWDVLKRMEDTAKQAIMCEEDKRMFNTLNGAATISNPVTAFSTLSIAVLENLRYNVEKKPLIVDKFLVNRAQMVDFQVNMTGAGNVAGVDPVTQREVNVSGYVGRFLGADILQMAGTPGTNEEVLPAGTIYAVTAPEYLGEMGIAMELYSQPIDGLNYGRPGKGFAFIEQVGFCIPNSFAVAKALKS